MLFQQKKPSWLKSRGYLHITGQIDVNRREKEIASKVSNPTFVAKHAFFPLIHTSIKERKYKRHPQNPNFRVHSYYDLQKEKFTSTAKKRPLHYATHIDSMIFGYYAEKLLKLYERKLTETPNLSESIIAYRKIPCSTDENAAGKSTSHFAKEVFDEILRRKEKCAVLMFDIKSFFSELDHSILQGAWRDLLKVNRLPEDHFNVFKAATDFSYILLDDLRIGKRKHGKRQGFDETKLAEIRRSTGNEAFFDSPKSFKEAINRKEVTIYKHPFVKNKQWVGIPQGLPISAILANLYLLAFDQAVVQKLVVNNSCYYRRYSDDILIICDYENYQQIEKYIFELIKASKVELSKDKTEVFLFREYHLSPKIRRLTAIKIEKDKKGESEVCCRIGTKPLTYLGFEFHGYRTQIKSANQAKFYRRLIMSVKRKANRSFALAKTFGKKVLFIRQIRKAYKLSNLDKIKTFTSKKKLVKNEFGQYSYRVRSIEKKSKSNYFSYTRRAAEIMNQPNIANSVKKKHKQVFNQAILKHFKAKGRLEL